MNPQKIVDHVFKVGAIDWNRRLFDSLIPLPEGTSYNAYIVQGSDKTALIDTVDFQKVEILMGQLEQFGNIDYIIANHAEQDHSGSIPEVLSRFPNAKVVTNKKCKEMLMDLLMIDEQAFYLVDEGDTLDLGGKTLKFLLTPWVHWPETMSTYLVEDEILFSCDFFGAHIATADLFAHKKPEVYSEAKRYYAEIMMPFRAKIRKNIEKVSEYPIKFIAPSHGPVYNHPEFIMDAYKDWVSERTENKVLVLYVSMHGSVEKMVDYFAGELANLGIEVKMYDMAVTDIGQVAIDLVDSTTLVLGTPVVLNSAHPNVVYGAYLANILQPKIKYGAIISSYGWGGKVIEKFKDELDKVKVEWLEPVLTKGHPVKEDFEMLTKLAQEIAEKHKTANN
ncbi:MAG: FprA family A-type flavoprotein [Calditrichia bacterium]